MQRALCLLSIVTLLAACGGKQETPTQEAVPLAPAAAAPAQDSASPTTASVTPAKVPLQAEQQPGPLLPKMTSSSSSASPVKSVSKTKTKEETAGNETEKQRITRLAATVLNPEGISPLPAMAYKLAKDIPDRLEKLYCYCHCHEDPVLQHKSLLSCYQDHHAVDCLVCQNEAKQAWLDWKDGIPVEVSVKEINLMYNNGNPSPSTPIPE
ncbi:MAG TPA: hypothetical protein VHL58_19830 [Thermoanaerobaculia bacterium]|nr:hypothetical protein [Thermoanaerobaculia bacterium]